MEYTTSTSASTYSGYFRTFGSNWLYGGVAERYPDEWFTTKTNEFVKSNHESPEDNRKTIDGCPVIKSMKVMVG